MQDSLTEDGDRSVVPISQNYGKISQERLVEIRMHESEPENVKRNDCWEPLVEVFALVANGHQPREKRKKNDGNEERIWEI